MAGAVITAPMMPSPSPEEPSHSCCCRVVLCPLSIASAIPSGFVAVTNLMATPVLFILLVCCKIGICRNCCPPKYHLCCKSVMLTPCRWMRASCTGKGELWCCTHPQWPGFEDPAQLILDK